MFFCASLLSALYFKEEVEMKELNAGDCEEAAGGMRAAMVVGAVIAWAFANRADLVEIGRAAEDRHSELNAEH